MSLERSAPGEAPVLPMGANLIGRLGYEPNGEMWVMLGRRDRPKFAAAPGAPNGTPEEISAAFFGFVSYYGTYSLDEEHLRVTHKIEFCSLPIWAGTTQTRSYTLEGNRLILRNDLTVDGKAVQDRLTWERAT
jgi:hypothetical protein